MRSHKRNSFITRKSYVFFILASVCNVLIVQLCSFVNQIILGQELGSDAVSAIGICTPVYQISTMIPVIIGMGAMLMAAKRLGVQDMKSVGRYFTTAFFSTMVICGILAVLLLIFSGDTADAYTEDPLLNKYVSEYMPWIGFIALTFGMKEVVSYFLTMIGKPKFVIFVSLGQFLAMILLDILFVVVFRWEMVGAAGSIVLSYALSILVVIPEMRHDKEVFHFYNPFSKWIIPQFLNSLKLGVASGIDGFSLSFLTLAINSVALYLHGSDGVFVVTVFLQMLAICTLVTEGAGSTVETLGSVYVGEKDQYGYKILFWEVMVISGVFICIVEALMLISPDTMCWLFGATDALINYSRTPLRIISFTLVGYCILYLVSCNYIVLDRLKLSVFLSIGASLSIIIGVLVACFWLENWFWFTMPVSITLFMLLCFAISFFITKREKEKELEFISLIPQHSDVQNIDFSVRYDKDDVADALKQIDEFIKARKMPDSVNFNVKLCVEEALYSIIGRATKRQSKGFFDVRVMEDVIQESRCIKVFLKVCNAPFNPTIVYDTEKETTSLRLKIINAVCPEISYNYSNGLNCTVMTFSVDQPGLEPGTSRL